MEGGWHGGVCYLLEVPQGCSCQLNILQCTLEGFETVVGKYIRWKFVPLGFGERNCSGKEAVRGKKLYNCFVGIITIMNACMNV